MTEDRDGKDETIETLKGEIDHMKQSKETLEKSFESERANALQEMSRGKSSALATLRSEMEAKHKEELRAVREELTNECESRVTALEREAKRELLVKDEELQVWSLTTFYLVDFHHNSRCPKIKRSVAGG